MRQSTHSEEFNSDEDTTCYNANATALFMFDMTIKSLNCPDIEIPAIKGWMQSNCKNWAFQLEHGEKSGKNHFQCRVNLKTRKRKSTMIKFTHKTFPDAHISPTTGQITRSNDFFYVLKEHTRIDGPWTDKDEKKQYEISKLPLKYQKDFEWYPWQQFVIDKSSEKPDDRGINIVIKKGNVGGTTLALWMSSRGLACYIPPLEKGEDIIHMVMAKAPSSCYFIDLPRAYDQKHLRSMYSAIENIKNGYVWETRYEFKDKMFDSPHIWILTNTMPKANLLTSDRWCYWLISDDKKLHCMNCDIRYLEENFGDHSHPADNTRSQVNLREFDLDDFGRDPPKTPKTTFDGIKRSAPINIMPPRSG